MRLADDIGIEIRTTGFPVTVASGLSQFLWDEGRDDIIITQFATFGQDITKGIQDHRATVLDLVVIVANGIGEDDIDPVVISPCGKPFHEPGTSFQSIELLSDTGWVRFSIVPQGRVVQTGTRSGRGRTHNNVWHKNHLRPKQGGRADIFDDVVIVADQDTTFPALNVKYDVLVAG